jgi:ATP-dependent RNA helicase RhlE
LLDLHKQGFIDLDHLHALVLDEADQMLDMGFVNDVKKIVKAYAKTDRPYFSRLQCQLPSELAEMFLTDPATVSVSPVSSTAENVEQRVFVEKGKLIIPINTEKLTDVLVFSRTSTVLIMRKSVAKNNIACSHSISK